MLERIRIFTVVFAIAGAVLFAYGAFRQYDQAALFFVSNNGQPSALDVIKQNER